MTNAVGGFAYTNAIPQWLMDIIQNAVLQATATGRIEIPAQYDPAPMNTAEALALIFEGYAVDGRPLTASYEDDDPEKSSGEWVSDWWRNNPDQWQQYALWQDPISGQWYKNLRDLNPIEFAVAHGFGAMPKGMDIGVLVGRVPDPENPEIYEGVTNPSEPETPSSSITGESPDVIPSNWDLYNAFINRPKPEGYSEDWYNTSLRHPNGRGNP